MSIFHGELWRVQSSGLKFGIIRGSSSILFKKKKKKKSHAGMGEYTIEVTTIYENKFTCS